MVGAGVLQAEVCQQVHLGHTLADRLGQQAALFDISGDTYRFPTFSPASCAEPHVDSPKIPELIQASQYSRSHHFWDLRHRQNSWGPPARGRGSEALVSASRPSFSS